MLGMFGIKIMSANQLLNGYANGTTPNTGLAKLPFSFSNKLSVIISSFVF